MSKWRKVLYEHQNVPDNYVDESFLDELKRNINVHEYNYLHVAYQTCSIAQTLSRVVWLVVVFVELAAGNIEPVSLLSFCMAAVVACYVIYCFLITRQRKSSLLVETMLSFRSLVLVLTFSYIFSPVIQTLTSTISSDTIYCMTFLTTIAHLIVHNYGVANAPIVSDVLSFNAAIFGAACLSSRLATPFQCFGYIVFAVMLFALAPEFSFAVKESSKIAELFQTALHISVSIGMLWRISHLFSLLFVAILILVVVVCPAILVAMQPLKSTISGPWDEAILDEKALNKKSKTN